MITHNSLDEKMEQLVQKRGIFEPTRTRVKVDSRDALKQYISKDGERISVTEGTVLYFGNETPQYCYYIIKGLVKVFDYDSAGQEFVYCILKENTYFLGDSIIREQPHPCSYSALSDLVLLRCSHTQINRLIKCDDALVSTLLQESVSTYIEAMAYMRFNATNSIERRLAALLLMYSERFGRMINGACRINQKISTRQIAALLGTSVISVTRTMKVLKDNRLVYYSDGHYHLTSPEKLMDLLPDDIRT